MLLNAAMLLDASSTEISVRFRAVRRKYTLVAAKGPRVVSELLLTEFFMAKDNNSEDVKASTSLSAGVTRIKKDYAKCYVAYRVFSRIWKLIPMRLGN